MSNAPTCLKKLATYPGIRVLTWAGDTLYAGRGYDLVSWTPGTPTWKFVARFHPAWWRSATSKVALSHRIFRDGFHAAAVLADRSIVAAVAGAIVRREPDSGSFETSFRITHGTRPLHITSTPDGELFWGEYFGNRDRSEVHIYGSDDGGRHWSPAYTFATGKIRHVHNIIYDRWAHCLWILTGDNGQECKIMRASCDLRSLDIVLEGNQQVRAVAAVPTSDAIYLSTDTPFEKNHIYRMDRSGAIECVGDLNSSSMYGCRVRDSLFFSTMVEPSSVNTDREVHLIGARIGRTWQTVFRWKKDSLPMSLFQYGNAVLPAGENETSILAISTIAVKEGDLTTTLWQVD